ncbi:hypothetical protein [Paenibacillus alvei]|nr:hypothetical protein [Paenibacillus alvei]EJW14471.1 hypothetical protein PAV_13c00900 [Paenibacillus alvei DSM 29]MEC0082154.1 hypothetical protein [Paenibacillus alvei]
MKQQTARRIADFLLASAKLSARNKKTFIGAKELPAELKDSKK